jgi:hypothetical protein
MPRRYGPSFELHTREGNQGDKNTSDHVEAVVAAVLANLGNINIGEGSDSDRGRDGGAKRARAAEGQETP